MRARVRGIPLRPQGNSPGGDDVVAPFLPGDRHSGERMRVRPGCNSITQTRSLPARFAIEHSVHRALRRGDFVGVQHGPHDDSFGVERFRPDIASRCARMSLDLEAVNRSAPSLAPFSRHTNVHDSGRELRLSVERLMNRHPQLAQSNFWLSCHLRRTFGARHPVSFRRQGFPVSGPARHALHP